MIPEKNLSGYFVGKSRILPPEALRRTLERDFPPHDHRTR